MDSIRLHRISANSIVLNSNVRMCAVLLSVEDWFCLHHIISLRKDVVNLLYTESETES